MRRIVVALCFAFMCVITAFFWHPWHHHAPIHRVTPPLQTGGVGVLFVDGQSDHVCTASAVTTPKRDLIVTAAHCLHDNGHAMTFVPGYVKGHRPYGAFRVAAAYVPAGWRNGADTTKDLAVFRLDHPLPSSVPTYAASDTASANRVRVLGYTEGNSDVVRSCTSVVSRSGGHPHVACKGYATGTSGSPWLTWSGTAWSIDGVIGGWQQGGCQTDVSYSIDLRHDMLDALIQRASTHARPDTVGAVASPGCDP